MTKTIILFNGPPGSGKDTASEYLEKSYGFVDEYKMAKPLKEACHKLLGLSGGLKDYEHMKNTDVGVIMGGEPIGMTLRGFYIHISENVMKPLFGDLVFGRLAAKNIDELGNVVVISDSGFAQEAQPVIEKFGKDAVKLARIHRPNHTFDGDSRSYISLPEIHETDLENCYSRDDFLIEVDKYFQDVIKKKID